MNLKILSRKKLKNIPSASGIEIYENKIYIVGDNSGWLFVLDRKFNMLEKIPLLKKKKLKTSTIAKKKKPDFEAMTLVKMKGEPLLLIFGSGSIRKKRDKLIMVFPLRNNEVRQFSLTRMYDIIYERKQKGDVLNIEAAVATKKNIYLFKRRTRKTENLFFEFDMEQFLEYILQKNRSFLVNYFSGRFNLHCSIKKIQAGISGACMIDENKMIFTASVEDTENPIDDGKILGSFIGIHNFNTLKNTSVPFREGNKYLKIKVESCCMIKSKNKTHRLLVVTDSDGGDSEILELELSE